MELTATPVFIDPAPIELLVKYIPWHVRCGFPSPADDLNCKDIDLAKVLVPRPQSTFFMQVKGDSMKDAGICDGSLICVDRSIRPCAGHIVVASIDGEFTVKQLALRDGVYYLKPANEAYPEIEFREGQEMQIWGVVRSTTLFLTS